jgi:hypothetical protein
MQSYSNVSSDYSADNDFDYGRRAPDRSPSRTRKSSTARRTSSTSRSSSSAFNGLHRRRNKHWNW